MEKAIQLKEKATINYIEETSYEDNTYWIEYKTEGLFGYEIVNSDDLEKYCETYEIPVDKKHEVTVCSKLLQTLINECKNSQDDMLFVEEGEITENEIESIQREIKKLKNEYENLDLEDFITFGEDDNAITIYGGICTKFLF